MYKCDLLAVQLQYWCVECEELEQDVAFIMINEARHLLPKHLECNNITGAWGVAYVVYIIEETTWELLQQ